MVEFSLKIGGWFDIIYY